MSDVAWHVFPRPDHGVPRTGCQPVRLGIRIGSFRDLVAREVRPCVMRVTRAAWARAP